MRGWTSAVHAENKKPRINEVFTQFSLQKHLKTVKNIFSKSHVQSQMDTDSKSEDRRPKSEGKLKPGGPLTRIAPIPTDFQKAAKRRSSSFFILGTWQPDFS
jgi:hypothetical protein